MALYERALKPDPFPAMPLLQRTLNDPLVIEPLRNGCRTIGYDFG